MWIIATALAIVLAVVVAVNQQRERRILERLRTTLRNAGDERIQPRSVEAAFDRLENLLHSDESDLETRRCEAAFEQLTTGAIIADADGQVVLRNKVARPYATGRHGDALIERVIQARLQDAVRGQSTDEELRLHGPPEKVLLIVGSPIIEGGELVGAVVLVDDVSEHQRLDAVRRDFIANVSHELRTPVGALSLLAETLQGETDPTVIADFLVRIENESERLASLIDNLLDLSRIDGGIGDDVGEVDLASVMREGVSAVSAAADHGGITVEIEVDPDSVATIRGDRTQLVSAVTNLLGNAVKYTPPQGTVSIRLVSHGDDVAIVVADTGIGIPHKDVNRVFERFYRVDRGRAAATGGTGLGLAIVRRVAINHGGRVELATQEGVGSTFSMILPISGAPLSRSVEDTTEYSPLSRAPGDNDE